MAGPAPSRATTSARARQLSGTKCRANEIVSSPGPRPPPAAPRPGQPRPGPAMRPWRLSGTPRAPRAWP
eukprot:11186524-Lingulodinium_polyedra.AAC.1